MRPATAFGADGPANLYNAVAVATNPGLRGRGALVVLNDSIHLARNVTKTNTTNVETFRSLNRGPEGVVETGKVRWFERTVQKPAQMPDFSVQQLNDLPRVDVLYAHANMARISSTRPSNKAQKDWLSRELATGT